MSILMGGKNMVSYIYELTFFYWYEKNSGAVAGLILAKKAVCIAKSFEVNQMKNKFFVTVLKVERRFCVDFSQFTDSEHLKGVWHEIF